MFYNTAPSYTTVLYFGRHPQTVAVHKFAREASRKATTGAGFQWYWTLDPRTASISADTFSGGVYWEIPWPRLNTCPLPLP